MLIHVNRRANIDEELACCPGGPCEYHAQERKRKIADMVVMTNYAGPLVRCSPCGATLSSEAMKGHSCQ